jgi:hypothetical protein
MMGSKKMSNAYVGAKRRVPYRKSCGGVNDQAGRFLRSGFYCVALSLIIQPGHAQFPAFPDSNPYWQMSVYGQDGFVMEYGYHMREADHDTLLNGVWYNSLWAGLEWQGATFAGGIREDDEGRVHYFHPNSFTEYLLYDFDPFIGETMEVWIGSPQAQSTAPVLMHITSIELLENNNGTLYKRIGIISDIALIGGQGSDHSWIQGVGGNGGLFSTWGTDIAPKTSVVLDCMIHNDTLWPGGLPGVCATTVTIPDPVSSKLEIWPNPTTGPFTVRTPVDMAGVGEVLLFDAVGSRVPVRVSRNGFLLEVDVLTPIPAGVYSVHVLLPDGLGHRSKLILSP